MTRLILCMTLAARAQDEAPLPPPPPPPPVEPRPETLFGLDGRDWTLAYGGALGVYAGGTAAYVVTQVRGGEAFEDEQSALSVGSVVAGAGAGLGTTWLLIGEGEPSIDQAMHLGSSGVLGSFTGYQLARALIPVGADAEGPRIAAAGLLGATAGTGIGLLTLRGAPPRSQTFALDLGALVGWQAGAGAASTLGYTLEDGARAHSAISLGGAAVLGGAALGLSRAGLSSPERPLLATSLGQGAWLGLWTPVLISESPEPTQVFGALRLGLGAGYLGALIAAPLVEQSQRSTTLQLAGALSGNAIGAGLPLALGETEPVPVVVPMLVGSVVGQGLGAVVAPRYALSEQDLLTLGLFESWTVWQAVGWNLYSRETGVESARALGLSLTLGGVGSAAAIGIAPHVDLSPEENALLVTGAAWGTWTGGWGGLLLDGEPEQIWGSGLVLGDIGLIGAAAATAAWDPSWVDVGLINGVGALGGALGGLSGVIFAYDPDSLRGVATASLVGSTLGLGAGTVVALRREDPPARAGLILPGLPELPVKLAFSAAPWSDEQGNPGVSVRLDGLERR